MVGYILHSLKTKQKIISIFAIPLNTTLTKQKDKVIQFLYWLVQSYHTNFSKFPPWSVKNRDKSRPCLEKDWLWHYTELIQTLFEGRPVFIFFDINLLFLKMVALCLKKNNIFGNMVLYSMYFHNYRNLLIFIKISYYCPWVFICKRPSQWPLIVTSSFNPVVLPSTVFKFHIKIEVRKPVRKVAALTPNFSHGAHTFSDSFRQYCISSKNHSI